MTSACTTPELEATTPAIDFDRFVNTGQPYGAPDLNWVKLDHFKPSIEEGMRRQMEEVEAIATNTEAPTFANTIEALEKSGQLLSRASSVMYCLVSAHTNDELQKIRAELSPKLSAHADAIAMDERLFARIKRGSQGNANDNLESVARQAKLRAERAGLLGYDNHAAFVLADEMAGTPKAALDLLTGMVPAAVRNARAEAAKLQTLISKSVAYEPHVSQRAFKLEPWDWDFYAEQVRKAEYDLDEATIKPYLVLDSVLNNGVFFAAEQLFGITFRERNDIPVYHPDVRTWEVFDADGKGIGLFYGDFFARDSKQGGAWMSSFVDQSFLLDELPVITNTCNYAKPSAGEPALISWDDVRTLFHEFGHGVHGMLSRVKHPYFSGTNVPRDFVEFPSQFQENFMLEPTVFARYARHHKTNEPMPKAMADKLLASTRFNQGYATTEYLAAALLDLEWHMLPSDAPEVSDPLAFEAEALMKHGIALDMVPPRYRTPYFSHIWGGGYSAGYYAYLWSEVLEADAYAWMKANGGMTRETGTRYRELILGRGGSRDARELFRALTGREPRLEPLLAKRGM